MFSLLQNLSPRQRLCVALVAGILASTALAPLFLLPTMYIAFTLLGLLSFTTNLPKQAFKEGFAFGFGYFASNIYWVTWSVLVNPMAHGWLAPLAVPLMAAGLAFAIAIPMGIAAHIPAMFSRGLALILLLALAEWLRGYMFFFPWNNFSQSFGLSPILLQPLSVLGRDGYGLLVLASLLLIPLAIALPKKRWILFSTALSIPLIFTFWGALRLDQAPDANTNFWSNAGVRIVQPNIRQKDKINPELAGTNLAKMIDLSFEDLPGWVGHIIWPEVALHLNIDNYPKLQQDLGALLPAGGALITGTLRSAGNRYYNSVISILDNGARKNLHDKVTLVPFGEYMPIPFIEAIAGTGIGGGFMAGEALTNQSVGQLPAFSTLVCYEVIFSGNVKPQGQETKWLLNLTNDAWFGMTSGPHQHAAIARWRAIEEGLPLIRAANTGISLVYDGYGRILAERELGTAGTINIRVPKPVEGRTFFSHSPNMAWIVLLVLFGGIFAFNWFRETNPRLRFEL